MISKVESKCDRIMQTVWVARSPSYWVPLIYRSCLVIKGGQPGNLEAWGNYMSTYREERRHWFCTMLNLGATSTMEKGGGNESHLDSPRRGRGWLTPLSKRLSPSF